MTRASRSRIVVRAALATITGLVSTVILYAAMRVAQALLVVEPDPALVIWSEHAGFFWRSWTVAYLGGMAAFGGWLAAGRDDAKVARVLGGALILGVTLLALQATIFP